jgi:hypothetical protein
MTRKVEGLEGKCRKYAEEHATASMNGDYRTANRIYDKLVEVLLKLRSTPDQGKDILRRLKKDSSDAVSMWAATHSLPNDEEDALAILEGIAKKGGIIGLNAEMVIKEWKAGRLTIR